MDEQLARAAAELPLMQDLPIGASPYGADAWAWQGILAEGAAMGVPPDLFNTLGQNWGLPPLAPHKLRAAGYQPLVEIVPSALRHAGGLRIDHVLGLFRSFWIPDGMGAKDGAYVRYPVDDLLGIIALESVQAQAFVVGEDLGTVEPGVREKLAAYDMLSYALVCFEERPPAEYPVKAVAGVTTHDLPTVAGLWSGSDLAEQQALECDQPGRRARHAGKAAKRGRPGGRARPTRRSPACIGRWGPRRRWSCRRRSTTPWRCTAAEYAQHHGTAQRPNWSIALPVTIEQLPTVLRAREIAAALRTAPGDSSTRQVSD